MDTQTNASLIFATERDYHLSLSEEFERLELNENAFEHLKIASIYHEKAIGKENIITFWEADLLIQEKSLN